MKRIGYIAVLLLLTGCGMSIDNKTTITQSTKSEVGADHFKKELQHLTASLSREGLTAHADNSPSCVVVTGRYAQVSNIVVTASIEPVLESNETVLSIELRGSYPNTRSGWNDWNDISETIRRDSDETKRTQP
jgi:hypothetical protein